MTNEDLIKMGFNKTPNFSIKNVVSYDLGRNRLLYAICVGTTNEMLFIGEVDKDDISIITDNVCIHNWDYDGKIDWEVWL